MFYLNLIVFYQQEIIWLFVLSIIGAVGYAYLSKFILEKEARDEKHALKVLNALDKRREAIEEQRLVARQNRR